MMVTVQLTDPVDQKSQEMPPILNHVLSAPVLYAVSLPPPRRKNGIWKPHTWLLISLIILGFFLVWLSYRASSRHSRFIETGALQKPFKQSGSAGAASTSNIYGVVFDAGSTGSRVHVFELTRRIGNPSSSYILTDELFEHVQPGLSSYADQPDKAAESLTPLLDAAMKRIPNGLCYRTPVVVRATAGLRLLAANKADGILSAVRQKLSKSCLAKSSNAVSILDGNQEGLYLWISLNFMTQRMPSPNPNSSATSHVDPRGLDRTVGTLDLGGGSTQITFAPKEIQTLTSAPEGFVTDVNTGVTVKSSEAVQGKHVYSQSYLGLGLMSARYSMFHTLTKRLPIKYRLANDLYSPCFPENISVDWSHAGRQWKINHLPLNQANEHLFESELNEASNSLQLKHHSPVLETCYAQALQVLRDPVESSRSEPVYPPSGFVVHRPKELLNQEFYAFSYVFDLATSVGLIKSMNGQQVTIGEFRDAANNVCRYPNPEHPFHCLDLSYITALLHDGYGFPWEKTITLQKKVDHYEISWGLGALFAELSTLKMG